MTKGGCQDRGFSLIEMMVVIAIISMLTMLGVPLTSNWVASAQLRETQAALAQGIARAKAISLRNPGAVGDDVAAAILCRSNDQLRLITAADADGATCSDTTQWSAALSTQTTIEAGGGAFSCVAFDNRGLTLNPSVAGSGSDHCLTSLDFTLSKASVDEQVSFH
ncbi:pilus assembly FimT family protein [Solimonas marina]|uniref:Prepilin-type N-terminal cleavage/methylation domain-containing protein n=1 Tax=Solimonas marina TaxID=2714601 RepID=A0A969W754_9GAMM|nr:prepilin-type N-terminal cleavage/methylation domain-containing protein [Solimonas marina]